MVVAAVVFSEYGPAEVLRVVDVDEPVPGEGQVRVRVRTAGVNPVDVKVRRGDMRAFVPLNPETGQRLGNEFAGVVDAVGAGVTGLAVGAEVLGFTAMQAYAQSVVVGADEVVPKPADLPWDVAGALSAVGQTAHWAVETLRVAEGEAFLVHAAAGGVGGVAVQLARLRGARVIGTASPGNHDYLRSLGATPVTYGDGLVDRVRALAPEGVDAALDCVGGSAIPASVELVADRGRIGTIVDENAPKEYGVQRLRPARSTVTLAALADLVAQGTLRLPVHRTFRLDQVAEAHREVETGHVRGKVVLLVD